ncbi:type II toxin-antitoxin system Phd/YefM family antitoxin [Corynebacterium sp. HS2168-gen11]|uniref:type II toxin-antitoxin system Phd/YefM family antitoxin n=1 Tax=Corynebacterium sp. HS2168-gen11 TaxID=2974027 RepID=UPI00216B23A3|nr:type II toxin-antitoxin system Phd/YefM family antitoxin [Corynebacterium sp. HS2168-gen11]MCS4536040.1 type II toxin-antitoxin system Phd/YefM family antitoxin [Corynebacterium sp. HS2168-gen11]
MLEPDVPCRYEKMRYWQQHVVKMLMQYIDIGDLGRGQASKLLKAIADGDDVVYALCYGKFRVVVMVHERYERLMEDGVDSNEH